MTNINARSNNISGRNVTAGLFLATILVAGVGQVQAAATITMDYSLDGATEGFKSTATAHAPSTAAGNPGADLGAQRRASIEAAAAVWGVALNSTITTVVQAKMDPQGTCVGTFTLGSAGSNNVHSNFANAPAANMWFPGPLANKIALSDLNAGTQDINATFNSQLDSHASCIGTSQWFYALDNRVAPANHVSFFSTALHEIGHGLCVSSFMNGATGELFNDGDGPDTGAFGQTDYYSRFMELHGTGLLPAMGTDAARLAAFTSDPLLHWTSTNVDANIAGANLSGGINGGHAMLYGPSPFEGGSSLSHWDETFLQNVTSKHEFMEPSADALSGDLLTRFMCQDAGWGATNANVPVQLKSFSVD